ncbi:hypothetical protein [Klebsiella quasipneumoniae]|uniref:hypothetical protein n=1 Tax=Klebsiella quasipneumoniae TaxID=1463165 RepID=UPI001FCBC872|nr:hypothetical protein [Klebsiella quasipneumoniae]MCJ5550469.1 hypothetical protein [Klebsiella quasipneumoniae]
MFKLIITLINYQNGDQRELVHNWRYKTSDEAWIDANKMTYVRKGDDGKTTHECRVKVVGGESCMRFM